MDKTSVYLDESDRRRLAHLAHIEGVSQAEIIRRAIERYEPARVAVDREFLLDGVFEGPGDAAADIPERDLLRGFGV